MVSGQGRRDGRRSFSGPWEARTRRGVLLRATRRCASLRGICRTIGTAPNRKEPITAERVLAMVQTAPDSLIGLRDRALLLLGFAGALRRAELVGLDVNDFKETKAGLRIQITASKTDQERHGHIIAIAPGKAACPIKALKVWLAAAEITSGPIFRPIFKGEASFG